MKRFILVFSLAMLSAGAFAQQKGSKSNDDFFKRNPDAKNVHWKKGNQVVIQLKSGKEEVYNLNDESQRAAVIARYGSLPVAPPPPPMVVRAAKAPHVPPPPPPALEEVALPVQPPPPPPGKPAPKVKAEKFAPR